MADFNYDEYKKFLSQKFDPYSMGKGEKIGLALSALASGFTRNQAPVQNYLSSVDMVNQQQMAAHQAQLSQYQAQMDATEHQKRMQMNELTMQQMKDAADLQKQKLAAQKDLAAFLADEQRKQKTTDIKNKYLEHKSYVDLLKSLAPPSTTAAPPVGIGKGKRPAEAIAERRGVGIEQAMERYAPKAEEAEVQAAEPEIARMQRILEVSPESAGMMGIEGRLTPYQKTQRERETKTYDRDLEYDNLMIQKVKNEIATTGTPEEALAFEQWAGGQISKEDALKQYPRLATQIEKHEAWRTDRDLGVALTKRQIANVGGGGAGKQPTEVEDIWGIFDVTTDKELKLFASPAVNAIRSRNSASFGNWLSSVRLPGGGVPNDDLLIQLASSILSQTPDEMTQKAMYVRAKRLMAADDPIRNYPIDDPEYQAYAEDLALQNGWSNYGDKWYAPSQIEQEFNKDPMAFVRKARGEKGKGGGEETPTEQPSISPEQSAAYRVAGETPTSPIGSLRQREAKTKVKGFEKTKRTEEEALNIPARELNRQIKEDSNDIYYRVGGGILSPILGESGNPFIVRHQMKDKTGLQDLKKYIQGEYLMPDGKIYAESSIQQILIMLREKADKMIRASNPVSERETHYKQEYIDWCKKNGITPYWGK